MGRVSAYEFENMGDETTRSRRLARHIAVSCHACATRLLFFSLLCVYWSGWVLHSLLLLLYLAVLYMGMGLVIVALVIVGILFDHYLIVPLFLFAPSDLYKLHA